MVSDTADKPKRKNYNKAAGGGGGAVYGLGLIGALVFYMQHADSFWMVLYGIFKAFVWPAFLIYKLLGM